LWRFSRGVSDNESFFEQFDEVRVDFSLGTIRDDEALPLAGALQIRLDRQDDGIEIGRVTPSSHFQRRGDVRPAKPDFDPIGRDGAYTLRLLTRVGPRGKFVFLAVPPLC
jgi:hypothetical protein